MSSLNIRPEVKTLVLELYNPRSRTWAMDIIRGFHARGMSWEIPSSATITKILVEAGLDLPSGRRTAALSSPRPDRKAAAQRTGGLTDWVEPFEGENYPGTMMGGNTARISNGKRAFQVTLNVHHEGRPLNFAVVYRNGQWKANSKVYPELTVLAVQEIIEAWIPIYPLADELTVTLKPTWD
jgi:hypothetical protein